MFLISTRVPSGALVLGRTETLASQRIAPSCIFPVEISRYLISVWIVLSKATAAVVEEVGGGGVEEASNDSAALGTGNPGALKFATNRKTLHMYDGTEWDRIAGGTDAAPVIVTDDTFLTSKF